MTSRGWPLFGSKKNKKKKDVFFALWIRGVHSPRFHLTRIHDCKGQGHVSVLMDQRTGTPVCDEEGSLKEYASTSVCSQKRADPN